MAITISIKGDDAVRRNLLTIRSATPAEVRASLHMESELIMTDIKTGGWVPKDTGALETSGFVEPTVLTPTEAVSTLGFGGAATQYALIQHEAQHFNHPGQGQAKYLEAPLRLWAPRILDPIASRIRRMWARRVR